MEVEESIRVFNGKTKEREAKAEFVVSSRYILL